MGRLKHSPAPGHSCLIHEHVQVPFGHIDPAKNVDGLKIFEDWIGSTYPLVI